jgi:hypothetical protein
LLLGAAVASAVWFAWMARTAVFSYTSVCPICGQVQETAQWQVPFTDWTYHTSSSVHPSTLSRAIAARHPAGPHTHQWLSAIGGGNGVICALGDGQGLLMYVVHRPFAMAFVDATLRYGDPAQVNQLLSLLRDRDRVRYIDMAAGMADFPAGGVTNAQAYATWWKAHQKEWDDFWTTLGP